VSDAVRINTSLRIPLSEIRLAHSTSSGPGGQHANKAATRVDLAWNVVESRNLGPIQRKKIMSKLANRIDSRGVLRLSSDRHRSQLRNREDVIERFRSLVAGALRQRKQRRPTEPTHHSKERRLADKRRRGELKRARRVVHDE
jgi:ribosome-associated protein